MKPPSTGFRTLRNAPRPTSLDRATCYPSLTASPIATSSRVKLPPTPPASPLASFRHFHTSPTLHSPPPSPGSGSSSGIRSLHELAAVADFRGTGPLVAPARSIHSSAASNAQPLEKDFTTRDDGRWDDDWPDDMPLTSEDWTRLKQEQGHQQLKHYTPPPIPSSGGTKVDYQPTDDDLLSAAEVSKQRGEISSEDFDGPIDLDFTDQMPDTFDLWEDDLESTQMKRKARRRRISVDSLPVLRPGQELEEGEERYDWRTRARSQKYVMRDGREVKRVENGVWYPEGAVRTERPKAVKLEPEQQFYGEVTRYEEHFKPLLVAEHEEELRAHAERQSEWSEEKLKEEGFMLDRLGATPHLARNHEAHIYTFAYTGKEATQNGGNLRYHTFKPGTATEICRSHPHFDYVKLDGTVNDPSEDPATVSSVVAAARASIEKLKGSVYSVTQKYIRVAFDTEIEDIEQRHWRLDIGYNDIALRRQLEAISYLHFDPQHLQRQDAQRAALEQSRIPRVRHSNGEEDSAFDQLSSGWPIRRHQTVLQGTNLRDKVLRAFQQEYIPHDPTVSLRLGDDISREALRSNRAQEDVKDVKSVIVGHETEPGDVDATPLPTPMQTGPVGIFAKNQMITSWAKRFRVDKCRPPIQIEEDDPPLTPTQLRAIAMMLSERLSLVQGPPGTGKTRVIIETIKLLKKRWQIPHPILVTAHTNAAVDNLLSGLREHGLKAARLGREEVVREDLREYTTVRLMESHPLFPKLDALVSEKDAQEAELKAAQAWQSKPAIIKKKQVTQGDLYALKKAIERDILLDADVICTTCLSAASMKLDDIDFPMVFLDEASMATEPLSLVPLMKGSSHVAIIGDHKQLPPVIKSEMAQLGGLATSMFERLIHEHDIPSIMLDTQYRMHPQIAAFPNRAFYGSALTNGTLDTDGKVVPGFIPPKTEFLLKTDKGERQNVTFVHHESMEDASSKSIRNEGEAGRVCDVVADLLYQNPNLKGKDIGIITPYTAQIRQINDYLRTHEERQLAFEDLLGKERAKELADIEIRTVDGFEGREKAVIIFSTVRNNSSGYIGFLADWRRLNVGLTRAKRALIMIGSADHLARARVGKKAMERLPAGGAKVWREFMAWLEKEELILRAE